MRTIGIALVALLVGGCTAGDNKASAPSATTVAATTDSYTDVIDQYVNFDGVLEFEGAKALFASTFADLPGVTAASAATLEDTGVLNVMVEHRSELTTEQRAVLDAVLGSPGARVTDVLAANGGAVRRAPQSERLDLAAAIIAEAAEMWELRLGRTLRLGREIITVAELPMFNADGSANFGGPSNGASAVQMLDADTHEYNECRIRINADAAFNEALFRGQVAHEVFHCFQYDLVSTNGLPRWVVEGSAAYAGEIFAGGSAYAQSWYGRWIDEPGRVLAMRSYDTIGLFGIVAVAGTDPFTLFDALLRAPTIDTIYAATGPGLRDIWGSHLANEPGWGATYQVSGPGAIARKGQRFPVTLTIDGPAGAFNQFTPDTLTAQVYDLRGAGDVIVVRSTGYGAIRFDDGVQTNFAGGIDQSFCLKVGGCTCPEGAANRTLQNTSSSHAFVGVGPGALPEILAQALDTWCAEDTPPTTVAASAGGCIVGSWTAAGITIPALPAGMTIESAGHSTATFSDGGAFTGEISGISIGGSISGQPVAASIDGQFSGTWSLNGNTLTMSTDGQLIETFTLAGNTQLIDLTSLIGDGNSIFGNGQFTADCSGSALTITYAGGVESSSFTRL